MTMTFTSSRGSSCRLGHGPSAVAPAAQGAFSLRGFALVGDPSENKLLVDGLLVGLVAGIAAAVPGSLHGLVVGATMAAAPVSPRA